jgi:adenosylcobinamide kinase/adenosylcobinamide-phosphate guanylyltransferase
MIALIIGGSGSGKSAYAEKLVKQISENNRVYIATMRVWDHESEIRVARHPSQRNELGFETVECPIKLDGVEIPEDTTVFLEDIPNLVANEMFDENGDVGRIILGLRKLAGSCKNLVMVTGNVFADGGNYDLETQKYMRLLAEVNAAAAALADCGIEVVYTIPVPFKGENPCV